MKKIIAIIPARGGSKRLPRKNIYPIWGKPMIFWAIKAAQHSSLITDVWVTTEDMQIKETALLYGAKVHDRAPALAKDQVYKMDAIRDCYSFIKESEKWDSEDIIISLQANSPQITSHILDDAINCFIENKRNELISVGTNLMQNAAFRIMKSWYVYQRDLSVKCGVYPHDLIDVHTIEDVKTIEKLGINPR
mgnify:CR=1 FL=1